MNKENELLKSYQIQEEIIVENKQAFAYSYILNSKRKINGCEARVFLNGKIAELTTLKENLESQLNDVTKELTKSQTLDNQLAGAGYCKIDNPIYQKIDGLIVKDSDGNAKVSSYTHSQTCMRKKEV